MKLRISPLILFSVMFVLILASLLALQNQSSKVDHAKLKVGVLIPLTGPAASLGDHFMRGLELAISEDIEIIIEDSQSNSAHTLTAAKKLIEVDNVDILVSVQATISKPLASLAEEHQIPLLSSIVSNKEFTRESEFTFNIFPLPEKEVEVSVDFIHLQEYNNVAVMTLLDEYGKSMNLEFKKQFNGNIVANEEYTLLETDYSSYLTKIKESNPDAIYFIGYPGHVVRVLEQLKKMGIEKPLVSSMQLQGEFVRKTASDLLDEEMYSVTPISSLENEKTRVFFKEFREQHGIDPDWAAPFGFDIALVLNSLNKEDTVKSLKSTDIEGLNGNIKFNEFGESNVPLTVVRAASKERV